MEIIRPKYKFDKNTLTNARCIMSSVVPKDFWELSESDFPVIKEMRGETTSAINACKVLVFFTVAINDLCDMVNFSHGKICVNNIDWEDVARNCKVVNPFNMLDKREGTEEDLECIVDQVNKSVELFFKMIAKNTPVCNARKILSGNIALDVAIRANVKEWYYILSVAVHGCENPSIKRLMRSLLGDFIEYFPVFFDDILE